jgi:hypothetical protein
VQQRCALRDGVVARAVTKQSIVGAAESLHRLYTAYLAGPDVLTIAENAGKQLKSAALQLSSPPNHCDKFEAIIHAVEAFTHANKNGYDDTRSAITALLAELNHYSNTDVKQLSVASGYYRCGVPWMTEYAWDTRSLEDPDELHASLRCVIGTLEKMCRVLTKLGKLPRYKQFCLAISNIEFSTKNEYDKPRQVYGDDLEQWLHGGKLTAKGPLNPCAVNQVPEPYQALWGALCTLHAFLYLLYRSGAPLEEFDVTFQELVHAMDRVLEHFGKLMWSLFPVLEMTTASGAQFPYSWMKRGCYYFYVLLPQTFRMRGVVGWISARAGESAQFDGVETLHECTPLKGNKPGDYIACGVKKHFGRSRPWWDPDEQRDAQERAHRKFTKAAQWARQVFGELEAALAVPWPADLVSKFRDTAGRAMSGECGVMSDESDESESPVDADAVDDDEQGISTLSASENGAPPDVADAE